MNQHVHISAQQTIDVLTGYELSPSTRDLLTLEAISEGVTWADDDELLALVDVILSEYEAQAVSESNYTAVRAIISLRRALETEGSKT